MKSILISILCIDIIISLPITYSNVSETIRWIPAKYFDKNGWPQEFAGFEDNGDGVHIGRIPVDSTHKKHIIGQFNHRWNGFYASVNGRQKFYGIPDNLELLVYPAGSLTWSYVEMINEGNAPPNMLIADYDVDNNEPIYICRFFYKSMVHVGVLKIGEGKHKNRCEINRNGATYYTKEMEVLSLSFIGIAMNAAE